jgi:hypothetical protein
VPFFTNAESEFVSSVVTKLQYEVFQPGMLISFLNPAAAKSFKCVSRFFR